mgnify:CR=1 FL=1
MDIHHIHRRKRLHQKLEKYPHKNKWINFLDKLLLIVAIIGPLMTLPQIFKIYYLKSAAGVSILTWSLYSVFNVPWLIYGIVHREKPIIIAYSGWIITNLIVIIGTLLYG